MPEVTEIPAIAAATRAFIESDHRLLINGEWVDNVVGDKLAVIDPATGEQISSVPAAGLAEVNAAVAAARQAFDNGAWRSMGATARAGLLLKLADLVEKNSQQLAETEVLCTGMPMTTAGCVAPIIARDWLRYYAGWATKITGETLTQDPYPEPGVERFLMTRKEAVGVAAQIVPWNFPLGMTVMKLGPALAAGCTVVLKPDEHTPLSAILLGRLINEAGFPPGVINIIPGHGHIAGAALAAHPDVDKISFTGSTEVGKKILEAAKGNLKKVTLELGGKSPFIVMPDADLSKTIPTAVQQGYFLQSQNCVCPSRMLVHKDVYNQFVDGLVAGADSLTIGAGMNPATTLGPLVSKQQMQRVQGYVQSGKEQGAELITGGEQLDRPGNFMRPAVFAGANRDMRIVREEIFGPVLSVIKLETDDIDEILMQANDTEYGLNGSVWTENIGTAMRVSQGIRSGVVGINAHTMSDINGGLGGYKQSGWGREMGSESLHAYLETKTIMMHY
ncbi:MAG: acyl-CoA reductase-like NAD-dependent aldehyde dehydrogenase [Oceanicoccus sp.]|jgi:acyl-CoA reductase-like NAD-dependent aldehyde dehydrogenase